MAKDRFVEVYSQGLTNVEKIIVDTETGVNYVLASSAMTVGCGMSVLVDAVGKPIVTPLVCGRGPRRRAKRTVCSDVTAHRPFFWLMSPRRRSSPA